MKSRPPDVVLYLITMITWCAHREKASNVQLLLTYRDMQTLKEGARGGLVSSSSAAALDCQKLNEKFPAKSLESELERRVRDNR